MDNNQHVKIVFWDRDPFQKHKKTVIGIIIKNGPHDFVINTGSEAAIIIPHRDILHIQELASGGKK